MKGIIRLRVKRTPAARRIFSCLKCWPRWSSPSPKHRKSQCPNHYHLLKHCPSRLFLFKIYSHSNSQNRKFRCKTFRTKTTYQSNQSLSNPWWNKVRNKWRRKLSNWSKIRLKITVNSDKGNFCNCHNLFTTNQRTEHVPKSLTYRFKRKYRIF